MNYWGLKEVLWGRHFIYGNFDELNDLTELKFFNGRNLSSVILNHFDGWSVTLKWII